MHIGFLPPGHVSYISYDDYETCDPAHPSRPIMLTLAEAEQAARDLGLDPWVDELLAGVCAGWRLDPVTRWPGEPPTRTKIGGEPDMAADEPWPRNPRGVPLVLLAQIDCSHLPPLPPTPRPPVNWAHGNNLIKIYADIIDLASDAYLATVTAIAPDTPTHRRPSPGLPARYPPDRENLDPTSRSTLPEIPVTPRPFLTAPERHPVLYNEYDRSPSVDTATSDAFYEWITRLRSDDPNGHEHQPSFEAHHLLGEPLSVHDARGVGADRYARPYLHERHGLTPDPALEDPDAWTVLLALHDDDEHGLDLYGGGSITILAPIDDLRSARYDRLMCWIELG